MSSFSSLVDNPHPELFGAVLNAFAINGIAAGETILSPTGAAHRAAT
jgi:hypothetical protein